MRIRRRSAVLGLALPLLSGGVVRADKLDKESKKWMEAVQPILLSDEEKRFKDLKDKGEREEFQRIFWARRNPLGPGGTENPYRLEYENARTQADTRFKVKGQPGSQTDCGHVFVLLGEPDEVKKTGDAAPDSGRAPEVWVYKDRPGLKFKDGRMEIGFDASCRLPQGARSGEQLKRVAEGRVLFPSIDYRLGTDGRLVRLVDQLPKPTPVMALLKSPRQDFGAPMENAMLLRSPDGATYLAGLMRVEPNALGSEEVAGKKIARVTLGVQALGEGGDVAASSEREVAGELAADGSVVVSYGLALKPGHYTLQVGLLDPKSGRGSVSSQPVSLPDFNQEELSVSPLLVVREVAESVPNPQDPLAAFQLGPMKMMARFGNVFSKDEAVTLLAFFYNAKAEEATGKPSTTVSFSILRDGKRVASTEDQTYDALEGGPSVGPVALTFAPGKYVAQIKVRDNVAKKDYKQETTFEIR